MMEFHGTTFDRPEFNRLIADIENQKINMVITKDLSRLGRDYIKTGYYIENYFPEKNIRFVAILDGIDTFSNMQQIQFSFHLLFLLKKTIPLPSNINEIKLV